MLSDTCQPKFDPPPPSGFSSRDKLMATRDTTPPARGGSVHRPAAVRGSAVPPLRLGGLRTSAGASSNRSTESLASRSDSLFGDADDGLRDGRGLGSAVAPRFARSQPVPRRGTIEHLVRAGVVCGRSKVAPTTPFLTTFAHVPTCHVRRDSLPVSAAVTQLPRTHTPRYHSASSQERGLDRL